MKNKLCIFGYSFLTLIISINIVFAAPSDIGDVGVYPRPPAPVLPTAGNTYIDPTFGTEILRVTDRNDADENFHNYSHYSPFNSNSTRFIISASGGLDGNASLYSFDPVAFTSSKRGLLFGKPLLRFADVCWSRLDPNVMYSFQQWSKKLYQFEPDTKTYTLIKDFTLDLSSEFSDLTAAPGGDAILSYLTVSDDDRWFGFIVGGLDGGDGNDNNLGVVAAYDKQTDTTYTYDIYSVYGVKWLHSASISGDGKYIYISPGGKVDKYLVNITAGTSEVAAPDKIEKAHGHYDMGTQSLFHVRSEGEILRRDYNNFQGWTTIYQSPTKDWSQEKHVSSNHASDDYVFLTAGFPTVNQPITLPYQDEIVQVFTDETSMQNTRRLVHHRSVSTGYRAQPHATSSLDGKFVMYASNWDNSPYIDVFILKVPQGSSDVTAPNPPTGLQVN